ncbi:MAG: hypothetical protein J6Q55_04040 [Clostridia bacterium]|nr:hypothetical protein [Clostridia bacterium]
MMKVSAKGHVFVSKNTTNLVAILLLIWRASVCESDKKPCVFEQKIVVFLAVFGLKLLQNRLFLPAFLRKKMCILPPKT